jgi:hypothetical protein
LIEKTSQQCEGKIRELMTGGSSEISEATLEYFSKCKQDQLKSFIAICQSDVPASLNKGKLGDANNGIDCLILRAFECRSLPPIMLMIQELPSSANDNADGEIDNHSYGAFTSLTFESRDLPSSLLVDTDFTESAKKCFDASDQHMKDTLGEMRSSQAIH